jgi:hypothetical protein
MRRSGNWIAEHTGVPRHRESSFAFGQMQFRRSGYGAMQLAGPFAGTARLRPELKRGEHDDRIAGGAANAAGPQGQEMVAASTICQVSPTRCQARTRLYRGGRLELEGFPVADISDYLADVSVTIWRCRAWTTAWKSWRTGCSTAFRGACRSSDAAIHDNRHREGRDG